MDKKHEENTSPKVKAQIRENGINSTDAAAQYEVFKNGELKRETLSKWLKADLESVMSLIHSIRSDERIFDAVLNAYYERYQKLHAKPEEDAPVQN